MMEELDEPKVITKNMVITDDDNYKLEKGYIYFRYSGTKKECVAEHKWLHDGKGIEGYYDTKNKRLYVKYCKAGEFCEGWA